MSNDVQSSTSLSSPEHAQAREAVQIRRATVADLPAIAALDERITQLPKTEYWQDLYDRFAQREKGRAIFVAEFQGHVAGFIVGEVRAWEFGSPPCGWIFALNVEPSFREHGVASAMFERITAFFRDSGVAKVRTMLRRDDNLVMSFFRSQGMTAGPFVELERDIDE
jgi:ribosomal protein S18 acetylase RimI-like enzyme